MSSSLVPASEPTIRQEVPSPSRNRRITEAHKRSRAVCFGRAAQARLARIINMPAKSVVRRGRFDYRFAGAPLTSASADLRSLSIARSPIDKIPTGWPSSMTGRRLIALSRIS